MTGSERLTQMYLLVAMLVSTQRLDSARIYGCVNAEHALILEAISQRDPVKTGLAMRNHVMTAKQRLMTAIELQSVSEGLQS